ncbi:hypothetical protein JWS13_12535 [Rhodococcus pseudokoreensis]|uniref:Uncharacterized protein n=1 Tax=Rhodococcus pseudokoreensis TaxID=2811421 RepID=A0A974W312_9NOCA|nr:hypothetical protein [Rhodococcus pseudokoreensis]QSE89388.1 hypothetical protein JWS13_12535 [Rhodococcus pseudokoreensis]
MEAHDVPDRLIPPHWSPAQVICAAFAAAATAAGLLVAVAGATVAGLGLVVTGLLTFAVIPVQRVVGPYLVVSGVIELQISLLGRSDAQPFWSHDHLTAATIAYGVAGIAAVAVGCGFCRIASSRYRRSFFGDQ